MIEMTTLKFFLLLWGVSSLSCIIGLVLGACLRMSKTTPAEAALEAACPDEVEPAKSAPRTEEITAARRIVAQGGCGNIFCGDCHWAGTNHAEFRAEPDDSGKINNNPAAVRVARRWLAEHNIPEEIPDTEPGSLERAR